MFKNHFSDRNTRQGSLAAVASLFRGLFSGRKPQELYGLRSADEMTSLLVRERARSDRAESSFALVAFTPRDSNTAAQTLREVARILHRRLRSFDDAGWLEEDILGVVLSGTDKQGAWTVIDDVRSSLPADCPPPSCRVYSYPSDTWEDSTVDDIRRNNDPPVSEEGEVPAGEERPIHAMEALFLQPTPFLKRMLDVLGASVGLVCLIPLFAVVAAMVRLTSPGPIFFCQMRSGRGGKPFPMIKFRSMVVDAEARQLELMKKNEQDGPAFKMKNDPRMTRVGRIIRATSIDELPQLWNVLRGEMSLVGPRPLPCKETDQCARWQRQRLDVTPGLTCIWQVNGRSKKVSFADWVRMDVRYIRSPSMFQDLKLIAQTLPAMMMRKGS